jgi:hypothetical protein
MDDSGSPRVMVSNPSRLIHTLGILGSPEAPICDISVTPELYACLPAEKYTAQEGCLKLGGPKKYSLHQETGHRSQLNRELRLEKILIGVRNSDVVALVLRVVSNRLKKPFLARGCVRSKLSIYRDYMLKRAKSWGPRRLTGHRPY